MRPFSGYRGRKHGRKVIYVVLMVGLALFYLWKKVELSEVARHKDDIMTALANLEQDKNKLLSDIELNRQPSVIRKVAEEQLGMVYPKVKTSALIIVSPRPQSTSQ